MIQFIYARVFSMSFLMEHLVVINSKFWYPYMHASCLNNLWKNFYLKVNKALSSTTCISSSTCADFEGLACTSSTCSCNSGLSLFNGPPGCGK